MSSKPTPLPRGGFLPLKSFLMRLPSSSSLLLASLAVSSSLFALAAPAGDSPESLSSPPPVPQRASIPHDSKDTMAQPNGYLQSTSLVDKVTAPLLSLPDLVKVIDVVKHLVSAGKTMRTEEADARGEHVASEDSPMQPFASQPEASAPPAAGPQDAPVAPSHPPAGFQNLSTLRSGPVRRQEPEGSYGGSEGNYIAPDPDPAPSPRASVPGREVGRSDGAVGSYGTGGTARNGDGAAGSDGTGTARNGNGADVGEGTAPGGGG